MMIDVLESKVKSKYAMEKSSRLLTGQTASNRISISAMESAKKKLMTAVGVIKLRRRVCSTRIETICQVSQADDSSRRGA